ncbi:hypothetical protein K456DRAFT_54220 [Colletotrichum gloeosporioides 23]|nr:hypothetical protein K456DRAFT_54220 [Colletotrichum gloeosporioides 23]
MAHGTRPMECALHQCCCGGILWSQPKPGHDPCEGESVPAVAAGLARGNDARQL